MVVGWVPQLCFGGLDTEAANVDPAIWNCGSCVVGACTAQVLSQFCTRAISAIHPYTYRVHSDALLMGTAVGEIHGSSRDLQVCILQKDTTEEAATFSSKVIKTAEHEWGSVQWEGSVGCRQMGYGQSWQP